MADKFSKEEVDYGPGDLDGQHCGNCDNFNPPDEPVNRCKVVAGKIRSGGWSRKWTPKVKKSEKKRDDEKAEETEEKEEA